MFGLLTAMQKRARDSEEGGDGATPKRAKGPGSESGASSSSFRVGRFGLNYAYFNFKACPGLSAEFVVG